MPGEPQARADLRAFAGGGRGGDPRAEKDGDERRQCGKKCTCIRDSEIQRCKLCKRTCGRSKFFHRCRCLGGRALCDPAAEFRRRVGEKIRDGGVRGGGWRNAQAARRARPIEAIPRERSRRAAGDSVAQICRWKTARDGDAFPGAIRGFARRADGAPARDDRQGAADENRRAGESRHAADRARDRWRAVCLAFAVGWSAAARNECGVAAGRRKIHAGRTGIAGGLSGSAGVSDPHSIGCGGWIHRTGASGARRLL